MMSRPTRRAISLAVCAIGLACTPDQSAEIAKTQPEAEAEAPSSAGADDSANSADSPEAVEAVAPETDEDTGETGEVELPEPGEPGPEPPEDYGVFKFPGEPASEDQLPLYGVAGFEVVAVYAEPNKDSTRLGFLRIGTRMRVGEKAGTDEECKKGWHALEGGGYACASKGLMVGDKPPFMSYEPKPPRVDEP